MRIPISSLSAALRADEHPTPRCCTDEPVASLPATAAPSAPVRWVLKLRGTVPPALSLVRESLRRPIDGPLPQPGARVETVEGRRIGSVKEMTVGVTTGRPSYAISIASGRSVDQPTLLIPADRLEEGSGEDVLVIDIEDRSLELVEAAAI